VELEMTSFEGYRKLCLKRQTQLRKMMLKPDQQNAAIQLFLQQHAMLHSKKVANTEAWSYEDEILDGMPNERVRQIPKGCEHSIAWLIWHMARCEDITMNLLAAGRPQVLTDDWLAQTKSPIVDTANEMKMDQLISFSNSMDIGALRGYRCAVGMRTREIVMQLRSDDLLKKVDPSRLQKVVELEVVVDAARPIIDYWGSRTIAGLLLMPASRHNLTHLNEAWDLKHRLK
jgi:hypothetical protein